MHPREETAAGAGSPSAAEKLPSEAQLAARVRQALDLRTECQLRVREVTAHTNVNYVYHVTGDGVSVYAKAATTQLKAFALQAPRVRVAREAMWARRFRDVFGDVVAVPEVLALDEASYFVVLRDVGQGRNVLLDELDRDYEVCAKDASAWGTALGRLARETQVRGAADSSLRPIGHQAWLAIMSQGARDIMPSAVDTILRPMHDRAECLTHTDLWGKNMLVGEGTSPGLLDFENAGLGDPAIDVSSIITAFFVPVLKLPVLQRRYEAFVKDFCTAYSAAIVDLQWGREILARSFEAVSVNLVHRAVGMAPYPMSDRARGTAIEIAQRLFLSPPTGADGFLQAVRAHR